MAQNINKIVYKIYNNLFIYYEYRQLKSLDDKLDNETFNKLIQNNKHIILRAVNKDIDTTKDLSDTKIVSIILLYDTNLYDTSLALDKLIGKITHPKSEIIIIGKELFKTHNTKKIKQINSSNKDIQIKNYSYSLFNIVIPLNNLSPKITIITDPDEISIILNKYMYCNKLNLMKRYVNDPAIIWIGGEVGQLIKIEELSETTCIRISYGIIVPV